MAKAKSKSNSKQATASEVLELNYTLAELPSAQHRAGLAGLACMIDWLGRKPHDGRCECSFDTHALSLRVDQAGVAALFDEVYGASREVQRSTSPWKNQEPLDIVEETVEERGKTKTKKYYLYPVVMPRGAFLADLDWDSTVDDHGDGPWIKLWRDMLWSIMRGVPASRNSFNQRSEGRHGEDAQKAYEALRKPDATVALASTYYLGAQDTTAETVKFKDYARFQFLLHFWPFVAQVYVPQIVDNDDKPAHHGYAIAVPDVADLAAFVENLPIALRQRDGEKRGFRPAQSLIDLPEEAALATFLHLAQRLAQREGERSLTADLVLGIDVFHMAKEGNNIRMLACGRVDPDERMIDAYRQIRGRFWSPRFRRLRLANLIAGRPWYHGFDRLCATTAWKHTVEDNLFKHDARVAFEEFNHMSEHDNESQEHTLEAIIYDMVGQYLNRKTSMKLGVDSFAKAEEAGRKKEYNETREKLGREAFLAARSRTGADFVEFFTATVCSIPQNLSRDKSKYERIARALLESSEIDKVRTLTLLALSARS